MARLHRGGEVPAGELAEQAGMRPPGRSQFIAPPVTPVPGPEGTSHVDGVFDAIDELNEVITQARESADPKLRAKVKGRRVVGPAPSNGSVPRCGRR
ncbi:hypothetical protein ETD83_05475 [Actinomadura soli]|uniref:Uncharacterized protein n=1 Tax=Actinomadura soli TaxID=2508997 RepID=A0A5C4JIT6_9ACTN|nr:hypothetical protein [Actinomadura soli]TMR05691.1 hypothetical protein ETD83_05475 [Actinomadura soli]